MPSVLAPTFLVPLAFHPGTASNKLLNLTFLTNNPGFPFAKNVSNIGFDPIIGQNPGQSRLMNGYDPTDASKDLTLNQQFVIARGGEYFFAPSISALAGELSV